MSENLKTGTTTVGVVCNDCVILGADKRATAGNMIAHKNVDKVQPIGDNMAVTTAGSVSDIQLLVKLINAEVKLKDIRSKRGSTVKEVANLLSSMVYSNVRQFVPGVTHFLLGGYNGDYGLYDIFPDGSVADIDDFVASGSGSVFAYGVLETNYDDDMSKEEGVELAKQAINAALQRDSASGNGIDIFAITEDGVEKAFSKVLETNIA
jgi:proteasome beta subunit